MKLSSLTSRLLLRNVSAFVAVTVLSAVLVVVVRRSIPFWSTIRPYFEGGQIPLRRLPHVRGFKARNHKQWTIVNLNSIEQHAAGDVVDGEVS